MHIPFTPYSHHQHAERVAGAPALEVRDLVVHYPGSQQPPALNGVSLCVQRGARVALVGPNGAGKSTLLKAIVGLLPLTSGEVRVFGQPVGVCHCDVAYLPQRGDLDWHFPISLRRLVLTGRYVHLGWFRRPTRRDWAIADAMIERLGLTELAERQIGELSGGQQQRALLARALAQESDLLLLDEPLNAVDADTRAVVEDVLAALKHEGKTVVAATHDLGRLESDFDGALYLAEGHEVPTPPGAFHGVAVGEATWTG